jgi:hypothetical protein
MKYKALTNIKINEGGYNDRVIIEENDIIEIVKVEVEYVGETMITDPNYKSTITFIVPPTEWIKYKMPVDLMWFFEKI